MRFRTATAMPKLKRIYHQKQYFHLLPQNKWHMLILITVVVPRNYKKLRLLIKIIWQPLPHSNSKTNLEATVKTQAWLMLQSISFSIIVQWDESFKFTTAICMSVIKSWRFFVLICSDMLQVCYDSQKGPAYKKKFQQEKLNSLQQS